MPAFAEHHLGGIIGLLDQRMHIAMARHALGVGVLRERSEAQAEGLMGLVREPLAAKIDHLVTEQRVADFLELGVRDLRRLQVADFGAHGGTQGAHLDMPVVGRVVIELSGWMESHAGAFGVAIALQWRKGNTSASAASSAGLA